MTARGWALLDHTADIALSVWAPDEPGLLEEGARAVVAILTEGAAVRPDSERLVVVDALDAEDRFVRWLNEVLYLAVSKGFLVAEAAPIGLVGQRGLRATVRGEAHAGDRLRTELKSVTYHDLDVGRRDGAWRARVVIDV